MGQSGSRASSQKTTTPAAAMAAAGEDPNVHGDAEMEGNPDFVAERLAAATFAAATATPGHGAADTDEEDGEEEDGDEYAAVVDPSGPTSTSTSRNATKPLKKRAKLNIVNRAHKANKATARLLKSIGGEAAVVGAVSRFYNTVFLDTHLQQFFRSFEDPHAQRLGQWVAEKMGGKASWSAERTTRPREAHVLADGYQHVVHDRSSAHVAAWYSTKRRPADVGQHFKLNDTRIWMRLHFAAFRAEGIFEASPQFEEWYTRFIGHFVSIYERQAPAFARESARWSADPANWEAYLAAGRSMPDVHVPHEQALRALPPREFEDALWPYERR